MLKYIVIVLILGVISTIVLILYSPNTPEMTTKSLSPQGKSLSQNVNLSDAEVSEVTYDGRTYQYYYRKLDDSDTITLIPNFDEGRSSVEIVKAYKCTFGINGGFYKEDGDPLGLFYTSGTTYSHTIESPTFNGFLAKEKQSQILEIFRMFDESSMSNIYEFAMQSGPYFDLEADILPSFVDQDYARRSLVASDEKGSLYFFIIYDKESRYAGPRLKDIPIIFTSKSFVKIEKFKTILNLDGGSASAYYDNGSNVSIKELKSIRSFLCGQK